MMTNNAGSGNYVNEDGSFDTLEDLQTSGRAMAMALGVLLKEGEGVIVDLPFQPKYPDDIHGQFAVYRLSGCIRMQRTEDVDSMETLEHGRMVWYHETPDK